MMHKPGNIPTNKPPLFRHWTGWYLLVVSWLVVLIFLFYWFTIYFS